MKKILVCLLLAFMLVGCGSKEVKLQDGSEVLWTSKDRKYTKADLFKDLRSQDYTSIIISNMLEQVASLEGIDVEKFDKEAQEQIQEILDSGYETYITYYYGSIEEYTNQFKLSGILTELATKDVTDLYDTYKEDYLPYKAEVAYFATKEEAQKVLDAVKGGEHTFAYAAQENGYTGSAEAAIYTDNSDLPVEVKDAITNGKDSGLTDIIQSSTYTTDAEGTSTITPRYYVVNVISKNADTFKDEFIEYAITELVNQEELISKYLKKYNVKVSDQRTYELLKDVYGDFR